MQFLFFVFSLSLLQCWMISRSDRIRWKAVNNRKFRARLSMGCCAVRRGVPWHIVASRHIDRLCFAVHVVHTIHIHLATDAVQPRCPMRVLSCLVVLVCDPTWPRKGCRLPHPFHPSGFGSVQPYRLGLGSKSKLKFRVKCKMIVTSLSVTDPHPQTERMSAFSLCQ